MAQLQPQPQGAPRTQAPAGNLYPWLLVAAIFMVLALSMGSTGAMGVFLPHMARELGWTRAAISASVALFPFMLGVLQPATGWLLQRVSPLLVLAGGTGIVGLALLLTRYTASTWHLLLTFSILAGAGMSASSLMVASALINRWFTTRRGLALGIASSGLSAGRLLLIPASGWLIVSVGWRPAWSVLGLLVVLGAVLTGLLYLLRPRAVADPVTAAAAAAATAGPVAWWRHASFWRLAGSFSVCGFTVNLFTLHLPGFALERGLPDTTAALALGLAGGLSALGTIGAGWLADFLPQRHLLSLMYLVRGAGLLGMILARTPLTFLVMAVLAGTTLLVTGNLTVGLAGNAFGLARGPMIYGFTFLGHQVAGGIAAVLGGLSFDLTGTYAGSYWLGVALLAGAAFLTFGFAEERPAAVAANMGATQRLNR